MKNKQVFICGTGIISPVGSGLAATEETLRRNRSALAPLDLFPLQQGKPLPVGQVSGPEEEFSTPPRTHRLALIAAKQALVNANGPPDAIILGTTTGGMLTTEKLLQNRETDKKRYQFHGINTVADYLADEVNCTGPALVVSTACSSGTVAIAMALNMLRSGQAETILAGGVDSLCRLTYFGFHSLQLVDPNGSKPLDINRQGMAVAEGAGMLLLSTTRTRDTHGVLLGAGLSCDAYHPAAPHPEGKGAFMAMQKALNDASITSDAIDYINLHGTGTPDNDLAESKAVRRLFTTAPPLSSIKGATGHSLAASGAIEAAISCLAVSKDLIPANTNLQKVDPTLGLTPQKKPKDSPINVVLSNSFGFGGNNGSLIIAEPETCLSPGTKQNKIKLKTKTKTKFAIHGYSCLTGGGDTNSTLQKIKEGTTVAGRAELETISKKLPPRLIRRLKRLPRMALSLASQAHEHCGAERHTPHSIFMGTGWGALSETYDFLTRLTESGEQFPSPTDFVGSVHNASASQIAIMFGSTGPNITTGGGDYSFEQAVLAAELMMDKSPAPALLLGADEGHPVFSPLLDPSLASDTSLADGGAAFSISREPKGALCSLTIPYYHNSKAKDAMAALVTTLSATTGGLDGYGLIMVGIPAAMHQKGEEQLALFMQLASLSTPVFRYRTLIGEFASASAVATALAISCFESGSVPGTLTGGTDRHLNHQQNKILVLGLGEHITALELCRP